MIDFQRKEGKARQVAGGEQAPVTIVTLPAPPSVNNLWQVIGKRIALTEAYRAWRREADWRLRAQMAEGAQPVPGHVIVLLGVERSNHRADIDNTVKALLDRLVAAGLIDDDSCVTGFAVAWNPPGSRLAHIAITPVRSVTAHFHPDPENGALGGWFLGAPNRQGEPEWL